MKLSEIVYPLEQQIINEVKKPQQHWLGKKLSQEHRDAISRGLQKAKLEGRRNRSNPRHCDTLAVKIRILPTPNENKKYYHRSAKEICAILERNKIHLKHDTQRLDTEFIIDFSTHNEYKINITDLVVDI